MRRGLGAGARFATEWSTILRAAWVCAGAGAASGQRTHDDNGQRRAKQLLSEDLRLFHFFPLSFSLHNKLRLPRSYGSGRFLATAVVIRGQDIDAHPFSTRGFSLRAAGCHLHPQVLACAQSFRTSDSSHRRARGEREATSNFPEDSVVSEVMLESLNQMAKVPILTPIGGPHG